jgi:hypothetical protein
MSIQSKQQGMGRREFLFVTSGTAFAAMAFGQNVLVPSASSSAAPRFALGYAEADVLQQASARREFRPNVVSADSLTPDGSFVRNGARVSIRGGHAVASPAGPRSINLTVQYVSGADGTMRVYPFYAWSCSTRNGMSSPISFVVPVDEDYRLRMLLASSSEVQQSAAAVPQAASSEVSRRGLLQAVTPAENGLEPNSVVLSLLSGGGEAKLRRGYYILAPLADGAAAPRWSSLQLRNDGDGLKLMQSDGFDLVAADFDYVILYIDRAKEVAVTPKGPAEKTRH